MPDPLRVYKPRERLAAATVNELTKAERARRAGRFNAPEVSGLGLDSVRVLIRNSSGDDIDQFAVLGIDGLAIERADNEADFDGGDHVILEGVTPEEESSSSAGHVGKFAVVQQPLADGDIGIAIVTGVTKVQIDVQDEDDQFADITDGDSTQLTSGSSGAARILWKEDASGSSEGTVWAVVVLGVAATGTLYPFKSLAPGSGSTRATDSWFLPDDRMGVTVDLVTRVNYNTSTHVLEHFTRQHRWDSRGNLVYIGEETPGTIDTAVSCS